MMERALFTIQLSRMNGIDPMTVKDLTNLKYYNIYYRKEPTFTANKDFQNKDNIIEDIVSAGYVHVVSFFAPEEFNLEKIWILMQGDNWSPNGEARNLIRKLGLKHTSMSIGDLIEDTNTGIFYEVAGIGFNNLTCKMKTEIKTTTI